MTSPLRIRVRFPALPPSTHAAIAQATDALARAREAVTNTRNVADRAARRCRAAQVTAHELQERMAGVKCAPRR